MDPRVRGLRVSDLYVVLDRLLACPTEQGRIAQLEQLIDAEREACLRVAYDLVDDYDRVSLPALTAAIRARGAK